MNMDKIEWKKTEDLAFDLENPRLAEYGLTRNSSETQIVRILWEAMDVRELVMSISASGFFRHEPLIVACEHGKNIVIEGNRRLAAVRLILNPLLLDKADSRPRIPAVGADVSRTLHELPVVSGTRENAWRYLGFKHVNGPAKWGSYAKSRYIADVHRNFGVGLDDIAKQIGDTHRTVQRLYRALMVIEEAERLKLFDREDRWRRHFSFSHMYTGLDYSGIAGFIGLTSESEDDPNPVPLDKKRELKELCVWLYGSKRDDMRPVVKSQNPHLRQLDAIVADREALSALRAGRSIQDAYETSRPSSTVFEESLHAAKRHLEKTRSLVTTSYDGSEYLLRIAGSIADIAYDLHEDMERQHTPRRKRRQSDGS